MHILLTHFHLYWRKHVLRDTYSNASGKQTKTSKRRKGESVKQNYAKEIIKEAHLQAKPGQNTTIEEAQD